MKQTNEKVYRCDHCNRAIVSAGIMKIHERMCKKNPNNQHQCFKYCEWLEKDYSDGLRVFYCGNIKCGFYHISLHSYKLERNYIGLQRIKNDDLTRMPLECEFYEAMSGHDFSEPNDFLDELNSEFSLILYLRRNRNENIGF